MWNFVIFMISTTLQYYETKCKKGKAKKLGVRAMHLYLGDFVCVLQCRDLEHVS